MFVVFSNPGWETLGGRNTPVLVVEYPRWSKRRGKHMDSTFSFTVRSSLNDSDMERSSTFKGCALHPVIVNTIRPEFDCELSNHCLINGSAEETEGGLWRFVIIFSFRICQHLSVSLCLCSLLAINKNFKTSMMEQNYTHTHTSCRFGRGNKSKTTRRE